MSSQNDIIKFKNLIERQRLNPHLWDYSYGLLKNNLNVFKQFRDLVIKKNNVRILDVGCGFRPWLKMFDGNNIKYTGVDFDNKMSSADFIAPADKFPLKDNIFDGLIYSEVFEHIGNLPGALSEMRRVAKNNALVYISSPFVFPEHGVPYDFQRLTKYYYQEIFKNDEILILRESNCTLSMALFSLNLVIEASILPVLNCLPFFRRMNFLSIIIYSINNAIGTFCDKLIATMPKDYSKCFYSMPLGFALIVRIKK